MHRRKISAFADGPVTFRWRDSADHNRQKLMILSHDEFLCRFLLHLLPKGFVRIHHFGFLANRRRASLLPRCFAEKRIRNLDRSYSAAVALPEMRPTDGHHRTIHSRTTHPSLAPFNLHKSRVRCAHSAPDRGGELELGVEEMIGPPSRAIASLLGYHLVEMGETYRVHVDKSAVLRRVLLEQRTGPSATVTSARNLL
jgi:hypothetical protein